MKKITLLLFIICSQFSFGQERELKKANQLYERYSYVNAQKIYQSVIEKGYTSADLYKRLGDSYYLNAQYEEAVGAYERLVEDYPTEVTATSYFRYATSLKAVKRYQESDAMMQNFIAKEQGAKTEKLPRSAEDYLRIIGLQKDNYEVVPININSPYSDFGPMFYGDQLIFASARDTGSFVKRVHKWTGQPFLDLYQTKIADVNVDRPIVEKFGGKLNTTFHESTPVFTNDGNTVYFTRNNYNKGVYAEDAEDINKLKIYQATKVDGKWKNVEAVSFSSDAFSTSHPALSPDGTKLYFSSDRPESKGETDLWMVEINEDGSFGEPKNLGDLVNSLGRESFPFISKTNKLYFASNGLPGLGGLDLFMTPLDAYGMAIEEPINLGEPANTEKDDFGFIIDSESSMGFLSSNRGAGGRNDDLYRLNEVRIPAIPCEILLTGTVTDVDTGEILVGATVAMTDIDQNILGTITTGVDGRYQFMPPCETLIAVRALKEQYEPNEYVFTTPGVTSEIDKPIALKTSTPKKLDVLLNPIYFDFDKSYIRPDAALELEKIVAAMEEYPSIKIDVRSHTDSRGDDAYNLALSERRNKSTIAYIIKQGIAADRLTGRGYGEQQLLNECANGVPCSKEKHELNRRSEFIIIEE